MKAEPSSSEPYGTRGNKRDLPARSPKLRDRADNRLNSFSRELPVFGRNRARADFHNHAARLLKKMFPFLVSSLIDRFYVRFPESARRTMAQTGFATIQFRVFPEIPLASYTVFPPTTVRCTFVPSTSCGATFEISRSSTAKSARYPGASLPLYFSENS